MKTTAFILLLLSCGIVACRSHSAHTILPPNADIRVGDVVLRCGNGLTSRGVLFIDKHGIYSHVGIVADSAGQLMVVHAVPGEHEYEGDVDRVKMETLDKFFFSNNAHAGAVLRYADEKNAREASREAVRVYQRFTLFDHNYDDSDTTRMYCCELVDFAFRKVGCPLDLGKRHDFHILGIDCCNVALPSNFLHSPDFTIISQF